MENGLKSVLKLEDLYFQKILFDRIGKKMRKIYRFKFKQILKRI